MEELIFQGAEARVFAISYLGRPAVLKERFCKKYRHPALDSSLTKQRVAQEARNIARCRRAGVDAPVLFDVDVERGRIYMEKVRGETVKEYLLRRETLMKFGSDGEDCHDAMMVDVRKLGEEMGHAVGIMHSKNIIHGDLTTSNMMIRRREASAVSKPLSQAPDEPAAARNTVGSGCDLEPPHKARKVEQSETTNELPVERRWGLVMIDLGLSSTSAMGEDKAVDLYVLERAIQSTHPVETELFGDFLRGYEEVCGKQCKTLGRLEEVRLRGRKRLMVG